jgi:indole-3-glycerol phosphate synthase
MILTRIVNDKKKNIQTLYETIGIEPLKKEALSLEIPQHTFLKALQNPGRSLIAEIKKASPSKGIIRKEFDPKELAKTFTTMGANAISVLTEEHHFLGNPSYIKDVKSVTNLPIIRKDFIVDEIQIYESKHLGANALLLIKALLTNQECQHLLTLTQSLGMDAIIEVHTAEELLDVLTLSNTTIIGINNRNLETFQVDIGLSLTLAKHIKQKNPAITIVAESGYQTTEALDELKRHHIDAVLIGEGLAISPHLTSYWSKNS